MQKWHFKPELQKFKKHRSGPKRFMKLFVVVKDNHILHLKKESSWSSLVESGNWILKKNKSLNAYSISLGNARTKIQLSSERSKSNLSFEPKNVCIAWKMCELCVFEDEAIFWKSPNPQVLPMRHSWPLCDGRPLLGDAGLKPRNTEEGLKHQTLTLWCIIE